MHASSLISIFSHTAAEYAALIYDKLGKGHRHALLVYREWYRTGKVEGVNPAFLNASALLESIKALTDFSYPSISSKRNDESAGKFLLLTHDKLEIETVCIPMQAGGTLCVSSQVGCRMGCAFCETGRMGLLRNLTASEIVSQLFAARFAMNFSLRNVVFMGMGEPFDNYEQVMQAIRILTDNDGFGIGVNHITVSTSGRVPEIYRLLEEKEPIPHLAVSLSAPTTTLRNKLMPINRRHSLDDLYAAMKAYCFQTRKDVLVAYVLIKGENDQLEHAEKLADYLTGLNVRINLIPYNPQSHDRFSCPDGSVIDTFAAYLRQRGYITLLRHTKGDQVMAACGQLGNLSAKSRK